MSVKGGNAPKDADVSTAEITPVHPMAVGVVKERETSEVHTPMCQANDDPNALAILLVVRAPRKNVNARAAGTRLTKERRARKMSKKKVHQMYVQSFSIEKETYHGFLEGKQLLH